MNDIEMTPHDLLKEYYPLEGVVAPLAQLIKTNPMLIEGILELAMATAIHAAWRRLEEDAVHKAAFEAATGRSRMFPTRFREW